MQAVIGRTLAAVTLQRLRCTGAGRTRGPGRGHGGRWRRGEGAWRALRRRRRRRRHMFQRLPGDGSPKATVPRASGCRPRGTSTALARRPRSPEVLTQGHIYISGRARDGRRGSIADRSN